MQLKSLFYLEKNAQKLPKNDYRHCGNNQAHRVSHDCHESHRAALEAGEQKKHVAYILKVLICQTKHHGSRGMHLKADIDLILRGSTSQESFHPIVWHACMHAACAGDATMPAVLASANDCTFRSTCWIV